MSEFETINYRKSSDRYQRSERKKADYHSLAPLEVAKPKRNLRRHASRRYPVINQGDRSTVEIDQGDRSTVSPELKLLEPVKSKDVKKNPLNLNLFNNIGVDADTLILLGLILLFLQEESQDTLMVCILGYILLG